MPEPDALPADPLLAELSARYLWWRPADGRPFPEARLIAQVMNIGTYSDIRRLESEFRPRQLARVMLDAAPGWFSDRSWEFWRGRLKDSGLPIPPSAPRRPFHAEVV